MDAGAWTRARRDGLSRRGSALVVVTDARAAVATTLVLREFDYTADVCPEPEEALSWLRHARYHLVIAGGSDVTNPEYAGAMRAASPRSRILLLGSDAPEAALTRTPRLEIVLPPFDVNTLARLLAP